MATSAKEVKKICKTPGCVAKHDQSEVDTTSGFCVVVGDSKGGGRAASPEAAGSPLHPETKSGMLASMDRVEAARLEREAVSDRVEISLHFSKRRLSDLLCSAFEGGSNYWYQIERYKKPRVVKSHSGSLDLHRHLDYPLCEGGGVVVSDRRGANEGEVKEVLLNLEAIVQGLAVFAANYPKHFADWLAENDDAATGDVFLQCCLFGEVVYG